MDSKTCQFSNLNLLCISNYFKLQGQWTLFKTLSVGWESRLDAPAFLRPTPAPPARFDLSLTDNVAHALGSESPHDCFLFGFFRVWFVSSESH